MSNPLAANRFARIGLLLLAFVLLGGLLLAWDDARGKESDKSPGTDTPGQVDTIDHPTGPNEVIIRIELRGGFMLPESHVTRIPTFTLYGDGCYIVEGPVVAIYPPPALPNLQQGCLTEEGIQQVLKDAKAAGLLDGDVDDRVDIIADAATTVFTVNADGKSFVTKVYAFGDAQPDQLTEEQAARRAKLLAFQQSLPVFGNPVDEDLVAQPEQAFDLDRLQVIVIPGAPFASDGVEAGIVEWPLATGLSGFGEAFGFIFDARCGVVEGSDLATLVEALHGANTETTWTSEGTDFTLIALPLLPDHEGCSIPAM